MRILVTGGTGFIGNHVVTSLLEEGHDVTIFDRHGRPDLLAEVFLGDIRDQEAVTEAVSGQDAVVNLAGIMGTADTIDNPHPSVDTNIHGSLNVFEACKPTQRNPDGIRCVHITTGNYLTNNTYIITNVASERFALMFNKEHGTKITVVRGFNVYGAWQKSRPPNKIIPNFIAKASRGQPIEIFGDGKQVLDLIYVEDFAKIITKAATNEYPYYDKIVEGGSGHRITVNQVAEFINKLTGNTSEIKHITMRAGETSGTVVVADTSTLLRLGISTKDFMPLEDGLKRTVDWYRGQQCE